MKTKFFAFVLILCFVFSVVAHGEGLLPSLTETIGTAMPSIGDVLHRYPDYEETDDNDNVVEVFEHVTEEEFNAYSEYLADKGANLDDYQVNGDHFEATVSIDGVTIMFEYDYKEQKSRVVYPKGTYDPVVKLAEVRYQEAIHQIENQEYEKAFCTLLSILGYKDTEDILKSDSNVVSVLRKWYTKGSVVTYGNYEQDHNDDNGLEPIEWIVLTTDNDTIILLSKYALDDKPFNRGQSYTWESSSLRKWLNSSFIDIAFNENEQRRIKTVTVHADENLEYPERTDPGNDTEDKVFILSSKEAYEYLQTDEDRIAYPTPFVISKGEYIYENGACAWLLRSPGYMEGPYCGLVSGNGNATNSCKITSDCAVRPVIALSIPYIETDTSSSDKTNDIQDTDGMDENEDFRILSKGDKGDDVKRLQQALIDQGFLTGKADGQFGKMTEAAVKAAQEAFGMEPTGMVDALLLDKLYN